MLITVAAACQNSGNGGNSDNDNDTTIGLTDPVTVTTLCGSVVGREQDMACERLIQPVTLAEPFLPVLMDTERPDFDEMTDLDDLTLLACLEETSGPLDGLGLVPSRLTPQGSNPYENICGSLPKVGSASGGGSIGVPSTSSALQRTRSACTQTQLDGPKYEAPIYWNGPETIQSPLGVGIGIAANTIDYFQKMSPEEKIAAGAALMFIVGPTLGALAVAIPAAAPVLLAVGEEAISVGVVWAGTGIKEKVEQTNASSAPPTERPPTTGTGTPTDGGTTTPDGSTTGGTPTTGGTTSSGQPAENEGAPPSDECTRALMQALACAGEREPCSDPELAKEMERIRQRACQSEKVYVDPSSTYCAGGPTPSDVVEGIANICLDFWSNRTPDPDNPATCPVFDDLPGTYADPIREVCLRVEYEEICPGHNPDPF